MHFIKYHLPLVLFALVWTGFGIFGFNMILQWQYEYEADFLEIENGTADRIVLLVTHRRDDLGWDGDKYGLRIDDGDGHDRLVELPHAQWLKAKIGDEYEAFSVNGRVREPMFDTGGHRQGKWYVLAFGVGPPAAYFIFLFVLALYRSRLKRIESGTS